MLDSIIVKSNNNNLELAPLSNPAPSLRGRAGERPMDILDEIIASKRVEVEQFKKELPFRDLVAKV